MVIVYTPIGNRPIIQMRPLGLANTKTIGFALNVAQKITLKPE
jgi:hypothetical protein